MRLSSVKLWARARIHILQGKTQLWNQGGVEPPVCVRVCSDARELDPTFIVWRGDPTLPTANHCITILGTRLGHWDFVEAALQAKSREHDTLFDRLVAVPDLQCAHGCFYCAARRANYVLRIVQGIEGWE